ncbi:hypothetical protein MRX96_037339 [Rhipicephalus microplus]
MCEQRTQLPNLIFGVGDRHFNVPRKDLSCCLGFRARLQLPAGVHRRSDDVLWHDTAHFWKSRHSPSCARTSVLLLPSVNSGRSSQILSSAVGGREAAHFGSGGDSRTQANSARLFFRLVCTFCCLPSSADAAAAIGPLFGLGPSGTLSSTFNCPPVLLVAIDENG